MQPRERPGAHLAGGAVAALGFALLISAGLTLADDQQQSRRPMTQLTVARGQDVRPVWSPDGARVAFQSDSGGKYQVWTMLADGSDPQRLSQGEADDRHPIWSPDGRRIAFDSGDEGRREIWVMDADGGGPTRDPRPG
jgi:Tol biopolymer transport system component